MNQPPDHGNGFTAHHLRFEVEALTPLLLPAHAGPSLRGALFGALQRHFCPVPQTETPSAGHKAICPVCWLMATEKPGSGRGRDVPRPYAVEPPVPPSCDGAKDDGLQSWHFEPGQRFSFGLTLFAQALNLFPYLVVAMPLMGQAGIGIPLAENAPAGHSGARRRGQFVLRSIETINPLTGEGVQVMGEGQTMVQMPTLPVTGADVAAAARRMLERLGAGGRVQIHFRTPTRIVEQKRLAHRPWLGPIVRRLLERLDALRGEFAGEPPTADRERLVALADRVRLVADGTWWVDLHSRSRRLGRSTPVGGFVGPALYEAPPETWQALLPHLLWGQQVHVGKSATKGDGWYELCIANGGTTWPSSNT
jgi:hypothetical protein